MCMIKVAYASFIICTQGCSCVHMNQPKNPNLLLPFLILLSHVYFCFRSFFMFSCFLSFCFTCLFVCLFAYHTLRLGFVFISLLNTMSFIHMFMHNAIGDKLMQGKWDKSCIHIPMHLWIWLCFDGWLDNMFLMPTIWFSDVAMFIFLP